MTDDTLIHLDGLQQLAARAAIAQRGDGQLEYERFGICSPDLAVVAQFYAGQVVKEMQNGACGFLEGLVTQFLAGFDIGYQARLELEQREKTGVQDDELDWHGGTENEERTA